MTQLTLFVGTYTLPASFIAGTCGKGIYTFTFDTDTGELSPTHQVTPITNPSFLAISPNHQYLYAVSELEAEQGRISAFAIDSTTNELVFLNAQSSLGYSTAHTMLDATGHYVLLANYNGAQSVVMLPIEADGQLAPATSSVEHTEKPQGTVPDRQDKAHAHCIIPDPTNQFAMVCDLGLDKIFIYKMDFAQEKLVLHGETQLQAGAGPRHLVFHPHQEFAYVIEELSSTVTTLAYASEQGKLEVLDTISALPKGYIKHNQSADIHITPDGRFLYASNRGHDSLAIYKINQESGRLSLIGHQSTLGRAPRNFTIDPSGNLLLVGNQDSDTIVVFRINQVTGELIATNHIVECPMPVCLKMVAL